MVIMKRLSIFLLAVIFNCIFLLNTTIAQNEKSNANKGQGGTLSLSMAAMCESVYNLSPRNPAAVFSIQSGRVACFTYFDPVPEKTFVFHRWYHKDKLSTNKKLYLKAPRWSTYSSIQLREADKGPWRVEVTDQNGRILTILRFSVTD